MSRRLRPRSLGMRLKKRWAAGVNRRTNRSLSTMKTGIWTATLIAGALTLGSAAAADKPLTPQQQKMSTCSQEAKTKGLKGDERQTFMSDCLKADGAPAANSQQEKMKDCNKQAAGKKGKASGLHEQLSERVDDRRGASRALTSSRIFRRFADTLAGSTRCSRRSPR